MSTPPNRWSNAEVQQALERRKEAIEKTRKAIQQLREAVRARLLPETK